MSSALLEVPSATMREVVAVRRDLHMHPELGFEEVRTAGIVAQRLRALGYQVRTAIGGTGVVGVLDTRKPGRCVLLRADMDALPVTERSEVDFASREPGKMHACGHDGHVAMLLGAADLIMQRRDRLSGTIVLCFQPAEEGLGGAKAMIDDGVLDDPHVDRVYGLHLWTQERSGVVSVAPGPVMASSDAIEMTVHGKGGHGAQPDQTVDPILAAAHFVAGVQTIVSRKIDPLQPAVVTIAAIHGGTTHNVIPDDVRMLGTMRAFDAHVRDELPVHVERSLRGCCEAAGATYEWKYVRRYPVTVNDDGEAAFVAELAARTLGADRVTRFPRTMGAEDFSFMLERRPGCFFFVGAQKDERTAVPHHNARFAIDEAALETGVRMMLALAIEGPQRCPKP